MSCIYRCQQASGFHFGAQQIVDVLMGKRTAKVEQHGHDQLSTFGIGRELDAGQWRSVVRQLVMQRLIEVDHERFNVLRLTPACREVLRGERVLRLRRQQAQALSRRRERRPVDRGRVAEAAGETDNVVARPENEAVFQALRTWRMDTAREHGVPAYTVFHDSTLHAIATVLPRTLDELHGVSGIGATKLERYGEQLLKIVAGGA
jgi:ATP-dependent DNA helicase RecQ